MDQQDFIPTTTNANQKIELVINQDQNDDYEEKDTISLVNIIENMKKKRGIFLRLTVVLLIIGLIVPLFLYQFDTSYVSSVAVLTYTVGDGDTTPSGSTLDATEVKSLYVVKMALQSVSLSADLSATSVADNISIERLISDETRQKLGQYYDMQSTAESEDLIELAKQIEIKYSNQYVVTLNNGFGDADNKVYIKDSELDQLLKAIVAAYKDYYFTSYVNYTMPENILDTIDLDTLDYIYILDELEEAATSIKTYCNNFYKLNPDYKSNTDGLSFDDFVDAAGLIINTDISGYYSFLYEYHISRDITKLLDQYSYSLSLMDLELKEITTNLESLVKVIENYKRDNFLISSPDGDSKNATVNTDYYNKLILSQASLYEEKHEIEETIKKYEYRVTQFTSGTTDVTKTATADASIRKTYDTLQVLYDMVKAHAEEFFDCGSVRDGYVTAIYTTTDGTSETDGVSNFENATEKPSSVVKNIIIGLAVAVVVAVIAWCCDGLVTELMDNKKDKKAASGKKEA